MPCGSLLDVFFMTFWYLLEAFWHLLDASGDLFWTPGRLLAHFGPGVQKVANKLQFGWTLVAPGVPNLKLFCCFRWLFSGLFFVVFLGAHFSHNLQFREPFGIQLAMLFGVPGTLGNRLKTLKGIRFSHFGRSFCRYDFQARSSGCFYMDLQVF